MKKFFRTIFRGSQKAGPEGAKNHVGYLPNEIPSLGKAIVFALQQFLVMLPATILAVIIMNNKLEIYSIPAAVLASGIATIAFLIITKFKIPLYYGSSFSYIPAIAIVAGYAIDRYTSAETLGAILIASILSGFMSIAAGILIKKFGKEAIDKILPPHVTGMVAMVIGLSLAGTTMNGLITNVNDVGNAIEGIDWLGILTGMVTFLATSFFTVKLKKGFISQIPILLGVLVGMAFSYLVWVPFSSDIFTSYFQEILTYLQGIGRTGTLTLGEVMPWITIPAAFNAGSLILVAIIAIFPIAFATIPESAAHVNQIDLYVNELSREKGGKNYPIKEMLGDNLIGDGTGDIIAVLAGGPAGEISLCPSMQ